MIELLVVGRGIVGRAARTSDPNGNLTSVPVSTFPLVYDDRNRLVQAKTTGIGGPNIYNYTYNASGERVLKYSGTSAGDIYEASVWMRRDVYYRNMLSE